MKERSATSCLKVLIVEDHPVTKLILLRWLRNQTFDVHFCSTEEEALDRLSHDVWHVLLTDLHLASDSDALDHQTGLLLLKYVRTVWPNVSCILMTAWGDQVSLSKAVRLGVDRILIKPLKSDDFLSVLHRLDQARKTRDALTKATHELELRRKSIEKLRERERQFALLIQEAGGLVSDFTGGHEFLEKGQIVAGNTKCFKAVLTAIQPHLSTALKR